MNQRFISHPPTGERSYIFSQSVSAESCLSWFYVFCSSSAVKMTHYHPYSFFFHVSLHNSTSVIVSAAHSCLLISHLCHPTAVSYYLWIMFRLIIHKFSLRLSVLFCLCRTALGCVSGRGSGLSWLISVSSTTKASFVYCPLESLFHHLWFHDVQAETA